jgi:hypothetical protein
MQDYRRRCSAISRLGTEAKFCPALRGETQCCLKRHLSMTMAYFKFLMASLLLGLASFGAPQSPPVVAKSGAITLKIADFKTARDEVARIAETNGGAVVGGQVRVTDKGKSHGWMRLVVPEAKLDESMHELGAVGSLYGDSLAQHPLGEAVKDLASRTGRLQQHQTRLSEMLKDSRKLRGSDILFVQDRLFRAGVDQDLLGHRREQMISSSNVSNISVYLFEPGSVAKAPIIPKTLGEKAAFAFGSAWNSFGKFIGRVGLVFASVVVYGIVWVPILVVLFLLWRKFRARIFRLAGLFRSRVGQPSP